MVLVECGSLAFIRSRYWSVKLLLDPKWEVSFRHLMKVRRSAHKRLFLLFSGRRTISDSQGICIEPIGHLYFALMPVRVLDGPRVASRCGWRPVSLHQTCSPAEGRDTSHVNHLSHRMLNVFGAAIVQTIPHLSSTFHNEDNK